MTVGRDPVRAAGERGDRGDRRRINPAVDRIAAYSWRLIVIAVVVVGLVWLLGQLRVVVFSLAVALLLARALHPVAQWLHRRGLRPGLAAIATVVAFLAVLGLGGSLIVPTIVDEFADLGPTVSDGLDDVQDWLINDSPFDVSQADLDRIRDQAGERIRELASSSGGAVVSGATLLVEFLTGLVLALLLAFFMLKDGDRFVGWVERKAPAERRPEVRAGGRGAWAALGGYLRGAALLGIVEAIILGITLLVVGADLIVPVMVLTFAAAFVPILGAVVAGVVAVLTALVTAGATGAIVVAVVAIVVQQLDNDLLAPVIYGRALALHPVTILLSLTAGGALFGLAGTILAVPVVAVAINVTAAVRKARSPEPEPEPEPV